MPIDQKPASVLGGENFAVCAGAPLEESFALLHYLCSKDVSADFCESSGKFPPRSDSIQIRTVWTDDPIMAVFSEQLQSAMPRGPHPRWPEVSAAISKAMAEVLTGARPAQEALNDAAAVYADIMSQS
jgi:multiple sugar transport system substrate-binding protein